MERIQRIDQRSQRLVRRLRVRRVSTTLGTATLRGNNALRGNTRRVARSTTEAAKQRRHRQRCAHRARHRVRRRAPVHRNIELENEACDDVACGQSRGQAATHPRQWAALCTQPGKVLRVAAWAAADGRRSWLDEDGNAVNGHAA